MRKVCDWSRLGWIGGFCLLLLGDVMSKAYTCHHIAPLQLARPYPYGGIGVFQGWLGIDFSLNYVTNKGAAWGLFSLFQQPLLYVRLLIIAGLLVYLFRSKSTFSKTLGLLCILTGAIGNVIDFFLYGHVVDLFLFCFWGYHFPVFNVADAMIFCGVVWLLWLGWREKPSLV